MNITKRPHYVPVAYLQFWSVDGIPNGRNSKLYVTDINGSRSNIASNTAVVKNFYSKLDPNSAEEYFQEFENDWAKLIKQFLENKGPRPEILGSLLLMQSAYFLLRNRSFDKQSKKERIEIYKHSIEAFWKQILMNGKYAISPEESSRIMSKNWICYLLPSDGEKFITSDNPTLTLNVNGITPAIIYLPMNPKWAVLALKKDVFNFLSSKITKQDIEYLNSYVISNCNREVYSDGPFTGIELSSLKKWIDKRPKRKNWFDDEVMHIESFDYPILGMKFSFLN